MAEQQDWALPEPKDAASALLANPSRGQKLHGPAGLSGQEGGPCSPPQWSELSPRARAPPTLPSQAQSWRGRGTDRGKQPGLHEDGWGMGDGSAGSGHAGLRFQQAESRGAGLLLGDQESLPSNRGITGHASALEYLEGTA